MKQRWLLDLETAIINSLLNEINKEDIILYCDAGSSINNLPKAKLRFREYLDIMVTIKRTSLDLKQKNSF